MRTIVRAILALSILAGTVAAADQTFFEGTISVNVPDGWRTEMDEQQLAMSVIHQSTPVTRVIFSTPNLNSNGNPEVPYFRNLDLMYMFFGSDLNIISENTTLTAYGKTGMQMEYSARRDGRAFRGKMFSFAVGDAAVLAIAISTEEHYSTYEKDLDAIIESYSVNPDAMQTNRATFQDISDRADRLYNELVDELEDTYEEAEAVAQ